MTDDDLDAMYARLTGKLKHYCCEWDGLPIDETMPEFAACNCFPDFPEPEIGGEG